MCVCVCVCVYHAHTHVHAHMKRPVLGRIGNDGGEARECWKVVMVLMPARVVVLWSGVGVVWE